MPFWEGFTILGAINTSRGYAHPGGVGTGGIAMCYHDVFSGPSAL